jgi:UDP-N-acetylglucosamine acyltransferase
MVNNAAIGGYAVLEDNCILSGSSSVHQFCRVGRFAMLSANSYISKDLPPFVVASGRNNPNLGINRIGLRRNKTGRTVITELSKLYKIFFCSGLNIKNGLEKIKEELIISPEVEEFIAFVETSKRGVLNIAKDVKTKKN